MLKSSEALIINGTNISEKYSAGDGTEDDYFIVNRVVGRYLQGEEVTLIDTPYRDGSYASPSRKSVRYIDVSITVKASDHSKLLRKMERFAAEFVSDGDLEIRFA